MFHFSHVMNVFFFVCVCVLCFEHRGADWSGIPVQPDWKGAAGHGHG